MHIWHKEGKYCPIV